VAAACNLRRLCALGVARAETGAASSRPTTRPVPRWGTPSHGWSSAAPALPAAARRSL